MFESRGPENGAVIEKHAPDRSSELIYPFRPGQEVQVGTTPMSMDDSMAGLETWLGLLLYLDAY